MNQSNRIPAFEIKNSNNHPMPKKLFLSICVTLLFYSADAQYPPVFKGSNYGNNPKAGRYAAIRGFKMYYEIYGKGEPLLLIHGNSGSGNNFSGQIPFFAQYYQVIVADSRAHGKSADPTDSLSYQMMADDFNALLDHLKIKSCYVIGWSDGGNIGLLLTIHYPDKVKKLASTGANIWIDKRAFPEDILEIPNIEIDSLKKLPLTPVIKNSIKVWNLINQEPGITIEQLNNIKCPTLIIGGDHDVILPKHTLLIAENIPKSNLWILPNSGHSTLINYKDQFNKTVNDFFKRPYRVIKGWDQIN
jgi:pimeloyl-ACP methyl ester carboxylesterase